MQQIRHATDSIRFAAAVSTQYLAEAALDWLDEWAATHDVMVPWPTLGEVVPEGERHPVTATRSTPGHEEDQHRSR